MKFLILIAFCLVLIGVQCSPKRPAALQKSNALRGAPSSQADSLPEIPTFAPRVSDSSLVGIWQKRTWGAAAGWDDNFRFYSDSSFRFSYNQMDCSKRDLGYSGKWSVTPVALILTISKRYILRGGHFEPSTGSCATYSELVDAVEDSLVLPHPSALRIPIKGLRVDSTTPVYRYEFAFKKDQYFKVTDYPEDY